MSERIIISFEDEENEKQEEKIVVDFDEIALNKALEAELNYKEFIQQSKINSCYRGNSYLNNFFESDLIFPEGIEQGFRKKFSTKSKDIFFNSILENNQYIILSSKNGNIYLIDRFTGKIKDKTFFEFESFEKTGIVYENTVYINSLKKIFLIDNEELKYKEIYTSGEGFFIWSNLGRYKDYIVFIEFNPSLFKTRFKILDTKNAHIIIEYSFNESYNFICDTICIVNECAYILSDSIILIYDFEKKGGINIPINVKADENSFMFYLNYRIYITSHLNELYYIDIPSINYKFKFSGIKSNYINSIAGFDDNVFLGTLDGWKFYKSSGLSVYEFDDEYENKIESVSRNILIISKKNKIVFCNLNRFQEAEGYVIASDDKHESIEIISCIFSRNEIFVLTKNGILEAFTNDKLNIHV